MSNNNDFAAPFSVSHHNMGSLLLGHKMLIPEMQRPYAWRENEASELVRDIERLMDQRLYGVQNPQHYFGTLVVLSVAIGRDEIIDGQQRLTTISVLLGVVQNSIRKLEERCLALERANAANKAQADHYKQVAQSCDVTASPILNLLQFQDGFEDAKVIYSPRLLVSPEIRKTYQSFIDGGDGEVASEKKTPATNLRKIAKYFRDEVVEPESKKDDEPLELLRHFTLVLEILRDSLIVVRLDTPAAGAAQRYSKV